MTVYNNKGPQYPTYQCLDHLDRRQQGNIDLRWHIITDTRYLENFPSQKDNTHSSQVYIEHSQGQPICWDKKARLNKFKTFKYVEIKQQPVLGLWFFYLKI